jgi:IclR family acetate operon transcriptional repressor
VRGGRPVTSRDGDAPSPAREVRSETVAVVERAARVLSLFAESPRRTLGVTEIAQALALSKTVVHRILTSLRTQGFVELEEPARRYRLGPKTLLLGLAYLERIDVRELARPSMEELSERFEETATLSVRSGQTRVYVDQVTPNRDIKMVVPLGRPFPLHAGASSKVLLAFLPDDEREAYLRGALARLTPLTVTDVELLEEELEEIRLRGWAASYGERQEGAGSVAAPILDHQGVPVASMSVCGPVERFRPLVLEVCQPLVERAGWLSEQLGYRLPETVPSEAVERSR